MTTTSIPAPADQPSNRLWVSWLLFFFNFLAVGSYYAYLNVYYTQAGLTGTQAGLLAAGAGWAMAQVHSVLSN